MNPLRRLETELAALKVQGNLRHLPVPRHADKEQVGEHAWVNLSSNDYLGLSEDTVLRSEFLRTLNPELFLPTASSSRLLAGNFEAHACLEDRLAQLFGRESALVFNSGYHMNMGILPAVSDAHTLILADKLVHASLIDGIRLSPACCIRYRHNRYDQLEKLLSHHAGEYNQVILVTESIFSMDGDEADLCRLVALKRRYSNVLLYVDEAHGFGVRGTHGLGCAEEQGCLADIDFLCGTFGKALASVGGYVVCDKVVRDYLINKMRTLIFTTALPPINLEWTLFVLERLSQCNSRREHLRSISALLQNALRERGYDTPSISHILPWILGDSRTTVQKAEELQRHGFYVLPVRPPTVPEGTSRIRFSLTAAVTEEDVQKLIQVL